MVPFVKVSFLFTKHSLILFIIMSYRQLRRNRKGFPASWKWTIKNISNIPDKNPCHPLWGHLGLCGFSGLTGNHLLLQLTNPGYRVTDSFQREKIWQSFKSTSLKYLSFKWKNKSYDQMLIFTIIDTITNNTIFLLRIVVCSQAK